MTRTRAVFFSIISVALLIIIIAFVATGTISLGPARAQPVVGLVGSEKVPFFSDERVQAALRRNGLDVEVQKAGSREIATRYNINDYDFVFPAGIPGAEKIQEENPETGQTYEPFFTPMAIATWRPIADLLVEQNIATDQGGYYTLNFETFVQLMQDEVRWSDLPDNETFEVGRDILLTSTDVRTSNSAAMYLALTSYIVNGDNIVQSLADAQPYMEFLGDIFLRQGFRPSSSQEPFEDYLTRGMGQSPMVMIYEAQFLAQAAQFPDTILPEMVLMYPQPTIFTEHILVPVTDAGAQLGQVLETDEELQRLAIEYGLRNQNLAEFRNFADGLSFEVPDDIQDVINPPSYETLEGMIQQIETRYEQ